MPNPKTSEKSAYLDRDEHISKGDVGTKKVTVYYYDSGTDELKPINSTNPLPVSATIDTTGLATSAKQDAQTALLTTIDADTSTIATEVAGLLTDTELRATPVPVSGTVTATPTGTQNVDVTANTIGLSTSANQTNGTQQTKLTDGTNTVAVGSLGDGDGSRQSLVVDGRMRMYNGTSFDRIRGNTTDGLLVNLGANNDVTVTGTVTATPTGTQDVQGNVASGASDSGNPVKIGGRYNSTQPTLTNGQRGDIQQDTRGNIKATLMVNDTGTTISAEADNADGVASSATTNNLSAMARNTVYNGTTWDRQLGNATDGTLVNLGANNDVTVTSGAITETNSAAIKAAVETIDNAISGSEMQVDVVGALPAGTNAIGKLAANSGVDIGDVDVTSSVSATLDHGSNLDIDTTAEQITTTSFSAKFGITLKADITNTGIVYIGNSDVTAGTTAATDGFPLSAGETLTLEVNNSNIPYAIASAVNQKLYWIGV
jgi:hypothetical protein